MSLFFVLVLVLRSKVLVSFNYFVIVFFHHCTFCLITRYLVVPLFIYDSSQFILNFSPKFSIQNTFSFVSLWPVFLLRIVFRSLNRNLPVIRHDWLCISAEYKERLKKNDIMRIEPRQYSFSLLTSFANYKQKTKRSRTILRSISRNK